MKYTPIVFALFLTSTLAVAGGTRTLSVGTDKFKEGDFDGTSLDATGTLRAGWAHGSVAVNGPQGVFCTHRLPDGSLLLGTSPDGKVYRVQGKEVSLYAETGELAVTAFAADDSGRVYAATLPGGKILALGKSGAKPEVVATLKDMPNVFALLWSKGALVAGGGSPAKILRITPAGAITTLATLEDQSVVSLTQNANGTVFAGTSSKGRLYEVVSNGKARVLQDFAESELKELVAEPDGSLIVAANDYGSSGSSSLSSLADLGAETSAVKKALSSKRSGKGALYKVWPGGRSEKLMAHSDTTYVSLSAQGAGRYCVGTGSEGRVYCANTDHAVTLVADSAERQVSGLAFKAGVGAFVSSDPVVVHPFLSKAEEAPSWASRVLDAGGVAQFGRLSREATGVTFETRTGNSDGHDDGWSAWEKTQPGDLVASPPGRYLQVRAKWNEPSGSARDVRVYYTLPNGRAVVTQVLASLKGLETKGDTAPVHSTSAKLSWKVDNDDGDTVRYRVSTKREDYKTWTPLLRGEEWTTKTDAEWDTALVPDGRYRVRVEATDAAVNAPGVALSHEATSEAFIVDNTAPVISVLSVAGSKVEVTVSDALSLLVRAEVLVDGRSESALPLEPVDGMWDGLTETLRLNVGELTLPPGEHGLTVRVWDAAGNVTVRSAVARK